MVDPALMASGKTPEHSPWPFLRLSDSKNPTNSMVMINPLLMRHDITEILWRLSSKTPSS